ncbi:MAG: DapH/DapD/GlmU-related protein [Dermatophilus congolensis]|nr:DapH/DapD/GlmU-related protein [Dermatophilus congolensis]
MSHLDQADARPLTRRRLASFTGVGYDKGAGLLKVAAWVTVGDTVTRSILCPPRARAAILRAFGADIAPGVLIRHDVRIHWPWKLTVGTDSWIGVGAWILNLEPVTIGSDVVVSQQAMLCTGSHDADDPSFEFDNAPIVLHDGSWVAARATVLRGVTVGADAIVGAGALVVKDVPAGARVLAPVATEPSGRPGENHPL